MNLVNWGRFGLLAALWGCSFAFIKMSLEAFAPLQLASGRLIVGALVVLGMLALKRLTLPSRKLWGHIAVASVFGNVIPFTLFAIGEQHTTATIAGVIQGATPSSPWVSPLSRSPRKGRRPARWPDWSEGSSD